MNLESGQKISSGVFPGVELAVFAGGCFWCMQPVFEQMEGVVFTKVGYTGGHLADPTYEQVVKGGTGHVEAIQIGFDPKKVTYQSLLESFWQNIDPFDEGGQFFDRGDSYSTSIYYLNDEQKTAARLSKTELESRFGKKIATKIEEAKEFFAGEEYHQQYHIKNPLRYSLYHTGSGREERLKQIWNKSEQRKEVK
jgi:peptide-methionine (S)-S-oxide reductase